MTDSSRTAELLHELARGDRRQALDRLMPIVYDELRRIAHAQLRRERPDHTLSTTALVHEAYVKLLDVRQVEWRDRAHFLAVTAHLMRRILTDHARKTKRQKRGGGFVRVPLTDALAAPDPHADDLLDLDDALTRLEASNERQCRVVECRCFAGMSVEETAAVLRVSTATVKRDWALALDWLARELDRSTQPAARA